MKHQHTRVTILYDVTPAQSEWLVGMFPDGNALSLTCDDCGALWDGRRCKWSKEVCDGRTHDQGDASSLPA